MNVNAFNSYNSSQISTNAEHMSKILRTFKVLGSRIYPLCFLHMDSLCKISHAMMMVFYCQRRRRKKMMMGINSKNTDKCNSLVPTCNIAPAMIQYRKEWTHISGVDKLNAHVYTWRSFFCVCQHRQKGRSTTRACSQRVCKPILIV